MNAINPSHYQGFTNGAQVIDIKENLTPNAGDAVKYLARSSRLDPSLNKGDERQDLSKALWYVAREIVRRFGADELSDVVNELPDLKMLYIGGRDPQEDAALSVQQAQLQLRQAQADAVPAEPRVWFRIEDVPAGVVVRGHYESGWFRLFVGGVAEDTEGEYLCTDQNSETFDLDDRQTCPERYANTAYAPFTEELGA